MNKKQKKKTIKILRIITRTILILFAFFMFLFALFSGAEQLGGGIKGILLNSPNAIPWLLLFGLVYLAFKKELITGIVLAFFSICAFIMFDLYESIGGVLVIFLPMILLSSLFILIWLLDNNKL